MALVSIAAKQDRLVIYVDMGCGAQLLWRGFVTSVEGESCRRRTRALHFVGATMRRWRERLCEGDGGTDDNWAGR